MPLEDLCGGRSAMIVPTATYCLALLGTLYSGTIYSIYLCLAEPPVRLISTSRSHTQVQIPFKNLPASIEVIQSEILARITLWMKEIRTGQGH